MLRYSAAPFPIPGCILKAVRPSFAAAGVPLFSFKF